MPGAKEEEEEKEKHHHIYCYDATLIDPVGFGWCMLKNLEEVKARQENQVESGEEKGSSLLGESGDE